MWRHVYRNISDSSKSEQLALFEAMKQDLFPEEREDIAKMLKDIRETRFSGGLACLHCGSLSVKKNGKYRARQRYLCKDCGKTFNDMTNTPLSGSRYPHKWLKHFEMMIEGYTLPKISEALEIHISTAFYWRHKILKAIRSLGNQTLKGIVERDETFFWKVIKGKNLLLIENLVSVVVWLRKEAFQRSKSAFSLLKTEMDKLFLKWQEKGVSNRRI